MFIIGDIFTEHRSETWNQLFILFGLNIKVKTRKYIVNQAVRTFPL